MRLFGKWHRVRKGRGNSRASRRATVLRVAGIAVHYGKRIVLPPRGAALRKARVGESMTSVVSAQERYWREPGKRVPRHKPRLAKWDSWRLSQGFIGGRWLPSQLRKPTRHKPVG